MPEGEGEGQHLKLRNYHKCKSFARNDENNNKIVAYKISCLLFWARSKFSSEFGNSCN